VRFRWSKFYFINLLFRILDGLDVNHWTGIIFKLIMMKKYVYTPKVTQFFCEIKHKAWTFNPHNKDQSNFIIDDFLLACVIKSPLFQLSSQVPWGKVNIPQKRNNGLYSEDVSFCKSLTKDSPVRASSQPITEKFRRKSIIRWKSIIIRRIWVEEDTYTSENFTENHPWKLRR